MVSLGTPHTTVLEDDWTVVTNDGTWASHWEHSVALTEAGPAGPDQPRTAARPKLAESTASTDSRRDPSLSRLDRHRRPRSGHDCSGFVVSGCA